MNRIIIIGNGFDLAHGLETGYNHFIFDYLKKAIDSAEKGTAYNDALINIKFQEKIKSLDGSKFSSRFTEIDEVLETEHINWGFNKTKYYAENNSKFSVVVTYNSNFFKEILSLKKWSDLEKFYFDYLIKKPEDEAYIKALNKDFYFLKTKLSSYLLEINTKISSFARNQLSMLHVIERCCEFEDTIPFEENFMFLDFNYTSLLSKYLQHIPFSGTKPEYVQIHGELSNNPDSIIFGYGDDSHPQYSILENLDNEELLINMKSFYYPDEHDYKKLIDFVSNETFDVIVVGHSLGLSDRVLLKTIFENENCTSIKLFHRGTKESQKKKRISLSRHCSDKVIMRKKIVPFDTRDTLG